MRWLFENPQLLFVLAGAIAWWLNERRKAKQTKTEMEAELRREPTADEMAERTRRIQEEIRRKIEERQGRPATPPPLVRVETVRPVVPPPLPQPVAPRPIVISQETAPGAAEMERVLEQQRRYAEQLDRLAAAERASQAATPGAAPITMAVYEMSAQGRAAAPKQSRGEGLLAALGDRDALRRAILLREILGAPKALQ